MAAGEMIVVLRGVAVVEEDVEMWYGGGRSAIDVERSEQKQSKCSGAALENRGSDSYSKQRE